MYLDLLREDTQRCQVTVLGYRLMTNHVHLVLTPRKVEGLAKVLKRTRGTEDSEKDMLRRCTYSGRPLGSAAFIEESERITSRRLAFKKPAMPQTLSPDSRQGIFIFGD